MFSYIFRKPRTIYTKLGQDITFLIYVVYSQIFIVLFILIFRRGQNPWNGLPRRELFINKKKYIVINTFSSRPAYNNTRVEPSPKI